MAESERILDVAVLVVVAGAITSADGACAGAPVTDFARRGTELVRTREASPTLLSPNIYMVRTAYISHGECGGHHHSVSTKPLSMSARNSDARFSGRVGASARFSFEGTRHARSSAA